MVTKIVTGSLFYRDVFTDRCMLFIFTKTGSCPTWRSNSSTPSPKARRWSPSLSSPLWVQTLWVLLLLRYCPQTHTSRLQALRKTGLLTSDPRLRDCVHVMRQSVRSSVGPVMMDKALFRRWESFYSPIYGLLLTAAHQINWCWVSSRSRSPTSFPVIFLSRQNGKTEKMCE